MNTHTLCFAKKSFQIIFTKYGLLKRKKAHMFLKLEKCYLWPWLSILITYVYLFATAYIYYGVLFDCTSRFHRVFLPTNKPVNLSNQMSKIRFFFQVEFLCSVTLNLTFTFKYVYPFKFGFFMLCWYVAFSETLEIKPNQKLLINRWKSP